MGTAAAERQRTNEVYLAHAAFAIAMGAISGLAASVLRLGFRALQWCMTHHAADPPLTAAALPDWRRLVTPILGAVCATIILVLRRRHARKLGREPRPYVEYVEAVRREHGRIPLVPNLWRTASASFSVASGAAIGREGSMIQFAAAITSWLQEKLRGRPIGAWLPTPGLAVACGVAGGVTTAYAAPVAGVFFAAEIVCGELRLNQLVYLGLAASAGWAVSRSILGSGPLYPTHVQLHASWTLWLLIPLALGFGTLGPVYQKLLRSLRALRRLPLALVLTGIAVGGLSLLDPRVWGNGDAGLDAALGHARVPGMEIGAAALGTVLLLRLLATTVCVGCGTVGGVFTPTLFAGGAIGALAGWGLAHLGHTADPALWAIVGMSALIAAVTHAPLMSAFMATELTGDWRLLPGLLLLDALAWLVARQLSPDALYAIASQAPVHRGLRSPHGRQEVAAASR